MTSNAMVTSAVEPFQALPQVELDRARLYLGQTKALIVGAIRNISEAQWNYKPGPERWSIAEILDHIIFVQGHVLGPIRQKLESAPITAVHPDSRRVDDIIIYQIPNRLSKFPSPAQPAGDLSRSEAIDNVSENYAALNAYLETTPGLRNRSIESAPLKAVSGSAYDMMDGYQWILAVAAHTERHAKQVLEVMAASGFPA